MADNHGSGPTQEKSGFRFLWAVPLMMFGVFLVCTFAGKYCGKHTVKPVAEHAASVAAPAAVGPLGAFMGVKLPNGVELNVPELGVERKLIAFIEDASKPVDKTTWFTFDRLEFETASSKLKPESQEQLKNVAEIMKVYPKVALKIGGYTDNVGNPANNLTLSQKRAENTRQELVTLGVESSRLEAEGFGDQHPIADNTTEEGRQHNRRIDLRVTAK